MRNMCTIVYSKFAIIFKISYKKRHSTKDLAKLENIISKMAKLEAKFVSGKENCSWPEAKTMFVSEQQTSPHFHNICSHAAKLVDITGQDVHFHSVCVHVFWSQQCQYRKQNVKFKFSVLQIWRGAIFW